MPTTAPDPGLDHHELAVEEAARLAEIDPVLYRALIEVESGGRSKAVSPTGARGLAQMTPEAAEEVGMAPEDIGNPTENLKGGARYLAKMLGMFGGDVPRSVAAYNAGPGAVKRHKGVPPYPETRRHGRKVMQAIADILAGRGR